MWHDGYSPAEIREMVEDACKAFYDMQITEGELRSQLGKLGLNATDIEDRVKENKP